MTTAKPNVKIFGRVPYAAGRCKWIYGQMRKQWARAVKAPCPHCGKQGW